MNISHMDDSMQSLFFENIDRVINAGRIQELQELQKLVKFIQHLIDSIINQIAGGLLSEKGAKIKILHLFGIIQHCQIGNHPKIKVMVNQLKQIYCSTFKTDLHSDWLNFRPKPVVLTSESIHHYIESIKDSQNDPIYSEKPKSLIDVAEKSMSHIQVSDLKLSKYYLSKLISKKHNYDKVKALLIREHDPVESNSFIEETKKDNRINFDEIRHNFSRTIATTA